ncbi:MAG: hypothetical protein ACXAC7_13355 [Candidatus Hodarchaeales archaeon]
MQDFTIRDQKVSLVKHGKYYKIELLIKKNNTWVKNFELIPISLENNENMNATKINSIESHINYFKVILGNDSKYRVITQISASESLYPWIHFRTTLTSDKNIRFINKGPEIHLTHKPMIKSQKNVVNINQPTKHTPPTNEWKSNDLPAAYIWNPESGLETFFFVNLTEMDWMSPETIERFSIYECGIQSNNIFGLLTRVPLNKPVKIPPNTVIVFDYYLSQNYREKKPTKWESVKELINKCFQLIPGSVPFPCDDLSWHRFSDNCISDLMKEHYCWEGGKDRCTPLYHAYVRDVAEIKRREAFKWTKKYKFFETMTMLDILPPWILYLQLHENIEQKNHVEKTCQSLKFFIDSDNNFLYNNIYSNDNVLEISKPDDYAIGDSWYFFEPIIRFGWLIRLLPSNSIPRDYKDDYLSAFNTMCEKAKEFVSLHNYEITAFYDPYTMNPLKKVLELNNNRKNLLIKNRGEEDIAWKIIAKNYACLGMYIYLMIQGFYFFKKNDFISESRKAADIFMNFSPDELFWEPLEIAYGVAGFTELYQLTDNVDYLDFANCLLLNELRMFYWYNDNSFNWKNKRNNLGLVQACIGIRYPAMKENVESIYPWLILLKTGTISLGILKFFNLIRINSFYYFSKVLPSELIYPPRRESPCSYIPFEDLEMLETPPHYSSTQEPSPKGKRTGILGREIYGAGEVIWLYLMFEALATSDNENIMILNVDLFNFEMISFPPNKQNFIIFNPLNKNVSFRLFFNSFKEGRWNVKITSLDKQEIISKIKANNKHLVNGLEITLDSMKARFIIIEKMN